MAQTNKAALGGQAVLEGVMMLGPINWCLAVRTPNNQIVTELHPAKPRPWAKYPLIRGVCSFFNSFWLSYKVLTRSAALTFGEAENDNYTPGIIDGFITKHFGEAGYRIAMAFSALGGLLLALAAFVFLPTMFGAGMSAWVTPLGRLQQAVLEGLLKIALLLAYLLIVRFMPDMLRMYCYHGAEHKTIACYEAGLPLTVENAAAQSRFHPRCGTSFILLVLLVSIAVNVFLPAGLGLRLVLKILFLPFIMGISYEILRFGGTSESRLAKILRTPGLWLQRLTTAEPDDAMLEVAIAALQPVIPPPNEGAPC